MNREKSLYQTSSHSNSELPSQLSQGQLAFLAPAVNARVFLGWTLAARALLLRYWVSGQRKHLRAFVRHPRAMRARAMEAKK